MEYIIGDKVSFLNEKGGGIVTAINNKFIVTVTTTDGFDIPYLKSELVIVEKAPRPVIEEKKVKEEKKYSAEELKQSLFQKYVKPVSVKKSKPHAKKSIVEIDLHIEELVDDIRGMSNFQIVTLQLSAFQKALNRAIENRAEKLIVIHGVGNGVLKNEICSILRNDYQLQFFDASITKYGKGATEVLIS